MLELGTPELGESQPGSSWPMLAVVFGIVAGIGVGIVAAILFIQRRNDKVAEAKAAFPGETFEPEPLPAGRATFLAPPALAAPPRRPRTPHYPDARPLTNINTRTLPSLSVANSQAIRVAASDEQPVRVSLRPIGPPGSFAVFSQSPGELNTPGLAATIPTGFVFTIPVGDSQTVDLHKKQALYGKGNVPGVRLSITTALVPAEY